MRPYVADKSNPESRNPPKGAGFGKINYNKPMKKIILASSSPRRKALLKQVGLKFDTDQSDYLEEMDLKLKPHNLVKYLSRKKAEAVAKKHKNAIVIAADTIIVFKNQVIGKPHTVNKARQILKSLSGKSHLVITGYTIIDTNNNQKLSKSIESKIYLRKFNSSEIESYLKSREPLDKAGGYGIQGLGALLIKKIEGDYYNIVGLPLHSLAESLKKFGIKVL